MAIGVIGCERVLPPEFPVEKLENAGNIVHGNAPFEMFEDCFHARQPHWRASGASSFVEFVNRHCTHLIVTMANTLHVGGTDGTKYRRLQDALERIERPIVIFGLGIHAASDDLTGATLPPEAIDLLRYLEQRCAVVGVRGESTKRLLAQVAGVTRVTATGCPSFFSRPEALAALPGNLATLDGLPALNLTKPTEDNQNHLLFDAIAQGAYLVEVQNAKFHELYVATSRGQARPPLPPALKRHRKSRGVSPREIRDYFASRYRLFRSPEAWYTFNRESVSYSYGTRFHANMATLLSGKPALWITHDARTRELTEFLHLPAVPLEAAAGLTAPEVASRLDYDDFLHHLPGLFDAFNEYLSVNGLPEIPSPVVHS